jgi:hypothetical protein
MINCRIAGMNSSVLPHPGLKAGFKGRLNFEQLCIASAIKDHAVLEAALQLIHRGGVGTA